MYIKLFLDQSLKQSKRSTIKVDDIYGFWKVLDVPSGRYITCLCTGCNNTTKQIFYNYLLNGKSKSCGCQRTKLQEQTFFQNLGTSWPTQNKEVLNKRVESNLQKYGVTNTSKIKEVKEKIKRTNLERYGAESFLLSEEGLKQIKKTLKEKYGVHHVGASPEVQDKIKQTLIDRYGVDNPSKLEEVKEKKKQTCLKLYGVDNVAKTKESSEKKRRTTKEKYGVENYSSTDQHKNKVVETSLTKYGVEHYRQQDGYRYILRDWCIKNNKSFSSKGELELLGWIQDLGLEASKFKDSSHELDIFVPSLNIGIEYNGLYHHSEMVLENRKQVARTYHLDKTRYFEQKNIRVIHLFENEWKNRRQQVKSYLLSALRQNKVKLSARSLQFQWSCSKEDLELVRGFLDNYHIQGSPKNFKYVVKVYNKGDLVAAASFGRHHRGGASWVLSRFCTKEDVTIRGCLSKISRMASKSLNSDIITWADYRLSTGNGYLKAGWSFEELMPPDYFYQKGGYKVIPKQSRQKRIMRTPEGMTELEHARNDGLDRVWDCGKIRFVFKLNN